MHVAGRQSGTASTASATRCTGIREKYTEKARTVRCSAASQTMFPPLCERLPFNLECQTCKYHSCCALQIVGESSQTGRYTQARPELESGRSCQPLDILMSMSSNLDFRLTSWLPLFFSLPLPSSARQLTVKFGTRHTRRSRTLFCITRTTDQCIDLDNHAH